VIQDGVAFGTSTGQLASLFDVCSVEVDRGPQGIFYGKNTTAGLINITRCAPTRKFGADIQAGYGTYNDAFLRGVFNAPIGDKGGFKLAAQYHSDDGYVKNVFDGKHVGQDHMFAINAVVNYDLTNWLNASLSYDHISESGGGNPVQYGNVLTAGILGINAANDPYYNSTTGSPIGLKPREVDTRPGSTSDTYQNDVLSLTLKAQTPFGDVVSQTAYLDQSDFDAQDYDGTCLSYPGCSGPGAGGNALLTATVPLPPPLAPLVIPLSLEALRTQTYKQFTQEERPSTIITASPFAKTTTSWWWRRTSIHLKGMTPGLNSATWTGTRLRRSSFRAASATSPKRRMRSRRSTSAVSQSWRSLSTTSITLGITSSRASTRSGKRRLNPSFTPIARRASVQAASRCAEPFQNRFRDKPTTRPIRT
jgi:outer membrane receptor protein involved in Fe transport